MTNMPRTLYDCLHARYPVPPDTFIKCDKGHKLGNGYVSKIKADRGEKLIFRVCALCVDFDNMGEPFDKKGGIC